jgi:putative transposase
MRIRSLNHSTYQHQYHIVWGTKYRYKYLKDYVKKEFVESLRKTLEKYPTLYVYALNVSCDHVHIQIEIPPNIPICFVVKIIKQNSSIHLRKRFNFIRKMYLEKGIWSVGYFSSTIGLNEKIIRQYIENQGKIDLPRDLNFEFE